MRFESYSIMSFPRPSVPASEDASEDILHEASVSGYDECVMIRDLKSWPVEFICHERFCYSHSYSICHALSERTGSGFYSLLCVRIQDGPELCCRADGSLLYLRVKPHIRKGEAGNTQAWIHVLQKARTCPCHVADSAARFIFVQRA